MHSLHKASLKYLLKHPWQFGLSVLGIAMGVAIVVSIDIANYSSARAFNLSMNAVAGKATHQIVGGSQGIPNVFYTDLRIKKAYTHIAPVIEAYVSLTDSGRKIYRLLGIDFFAERPFRDYLAQAAFSIDGELKDFLTSPNAVALSQQSLDELGKTTGDSLHVLIGGKRKIVQIVGLIETEETNRSILENLLIADIATAQVLKEQYESIDYIDLILTEEEAKTLKAILPPEFDLRKSGMRSQTAEQMLEAFRINLTALSLLALIVGLFLIYNTMTFSVVQRRTLIGTLRAIGVTSSEVSGIVMREAFFIGLLGTISGFVIAFFISRYLIGLVSQTINDLYFVLEVSEIYISTAIVLKGILIGIVATLVSALKPAKEASSVHPRAAMVRSELESSIIKKIPVMSVTGGISILLGTILLLIPIKNVWVSYIGILPIIIGFALLTPLIILFVEKLVSPVYKSLFGITGKAASRSILQNISRTYVAIAALALAVAATVGVGTMISSFRTTVTKWLEARLSGDIFVTAPSMISRRNDTVLPYNMLTKIRHIEGVKDINFYRELELVQEGKSYNLIASGIRRSEYTGFQFKEGDPEAAWQGFEQGELLLTEPFAFKHNLHVGSMLRLRTDRGMHEFRVAGIYYDYASDLGFMVMQYDQFIKFWDTDGISGISVFIDSEADLEQVKQRIQNIATSGQQLLVRTYKYIRESSIEIFDRTFIIANVLQMLAVIVAFIGILSSLMSLQLERRRELGILRANGLLPSQLFKMIQLQTILMGLTAGVLALPLGSLLAAILVYIINKRSFGWTMQFELIPWIMLEALLLALIAACVAGIYPGVKMSRSSPALAMREE